MLNPKVISILLLLLISMGSVQSQGEDGELIFAHTLCRHGDRNIRKSYPTDPWKSSKYWEGGYGALTALGRLQHYALGRYLRKRYSSLLGNDDCLQDKIHIRSTKKDRVVKSAQANIAGLFSSPYDDKWSEQFGVQPIPIYTTPHRQDYILTSGKPCDRSKYFKSQYKKTAEYKDLDDQCRLLAKEIEKYSGKIGKRLSCLSKMAILYDTLFIEQLKGKSLPEWAEELMSNRDDFKYFAFQAFLSSTRTTELKRLNAGYLLKDILNRSAIKALKPSSLNETLYMYFAHDSTLASVLNTLGVFELHQPPFASCLFFELYKADRSYLQIFYKNSSEINNISLLNIPNCGEQCPLFKLYKLYDDVLPRESYEEECELRDGETLSPDETEEITDTEEIFEEFTNFFDFFKR